ncbi:hypothetical protein LJC56_02600 [Christensenellaceae bacterium OttesenSCG-928-K19]|nr:hypothetical protein [Christensenellaceae bacterium OttesenSCG-928-K19]
MTTRLEREHYLRAADVDINGKWMPSAVFVRMQELAEDHATKVGAGRIYLGETMGLAWVLTRVYLKMYRYPCLGDTITVATWPLKPTKLTFLRHFKMTDSTGDTLGVASSQWVLFDINDRILRRTAIIGDYPYDPDAPTMLEEPGKIKLPPDMEFKETRKVRYSDVDMNGHMNNTKYLNWICELFPSEHLKTKRIDEIKLNYIAEPYLDQNVDLFYKEADGGWFVCGKTEEKTIFDSFVTWI